MERKDRLVLWTEIGCFVLIAPSGRTVVMLESAQPKAQKLREVAVEDVKETSLAVIWPFAKIQIS